MKACCPVVELRQYTLHPGRRDELIALFEREFVEPQEAVGATVIGTFRDLDADDRFVWLRGFSDMDARKAALTSFYGGPVWKAHREAANATMIDSDNVLLLRPAGPGAGFQLDGLARPGLDAPEGPRGLVSATLLPLRSAADAELAGLFERELKPALAEADVGVLAVFETEDAANSFPALPVREGERVFVWFSAFADDQAHAAHLERLQASQKWRAAWAKLEPRLKSPAQTLRLAPTRRSLVRSVDPPPSGAVGEGDREAVEGAARRPIRGRV